MKTLIIHPDDRTTDFLKDIYLSLAEYTLVTRGTKEEVDLLITSHDRVIMCGHGSPYGLFSVKQFGSSSYIIDSDSVSLLKGKTCIYIWCDADKFVQANSLKGLYSGMFVSEVIESIMMGIGPVPQRVVDQSNKYFAKVMGKNIRNDLFEIYQNVLKTYRNFAKDNIVADYNVKRFYLNI